MTSYDSQAYAQRSIPTLDRVRYFPRQLITADDMRAEQEYIREKLRRHNRYLHGWGVVCGCEVVAAPDAEHPWQVKICAGYVITPRGDEVLIPHEVLFDLAEDRRPSYDPCANVVPCPPTSRTVPENGTKTVYLAVCYDECDARPVRIHPAGCGCDDAACEYSRVREGFELVQLPEWPESHRLAEREDEVLCSDFQDWITSQGTPRPGNRVESRPAQFVPICPESSDDACVVLAQITLPDKRTSSIGGKTDGGRIGYEGRRSLYSTRTLQQLCACIPDATSEFSISIQPKTARLTLGGTQQFTATVTGADTTTLTWSLQEEAGGTVSATGLYTAPQTGGTYHVVATATNRDGLTKSDTATVTVAPEISVRIEPRDVQLNFLGERLSQQFTATVTGSTNTAVEWRLEEGEVWGTINQAGLYTAPEGPGNFVIHIVATSVADPYPSDSVTVTVAALT